MCVDWWKRRAFGNAAYKISPKCSMTTEKCHISSSSLTMTHESIAFEKPWKNLLRSAVFLIIGESGCRCRTTSGTTLIAPREQMWLVKLSQRRTSDGGSPELRRLCSQSITQSDASGRFFEFFNFTDLYHRLPPVSPSSFTVRAWATVWCVSVCCDAFCLKRPPELTSELPFVNCETRLCLGDLTTGEPY